MDVTRAEKCLTFDPVSKHYEGKSVVFSNIEGVG